MAELAASTSATGQDPVVVPLRVLILEDRMSDAQLLLHELRRAGFSPEWRLAHDEPGYLEHLTPELDVILADYTLPQFDALRALRLLQERGLDVPFIVVTGSISEEAAVECMKQGAADYLLKDRLARLGPALIRALEQHRLRAVHGLLNSAAAPWSLEELLRGLLHRLQGMLRTDMATVLLLRPSEERPSVQAVHGFGHDQTIDQLFGSPAGQGIARRAAATRSPVVLPDLTREEPESPFVRAGLRSVVATPLILQGRVVGVLQLASRRLRGFEEDEVRLLEIVGDRVAAAIERARLYDELRSGAEQLRHLSLRLVETQEQERRHIARELHDEIGQLLTGLKLSLQIAARPGGQGRGLDEAQRLTDELIGRVRALSLDLRPPVLDDLGLLPALVWLIDRFAAQTGVRVELEHAGLERRLPPALETAAFRIVQEALTNVARHAGVDTARVRVRIVEGSVAVEVEDRGAGFEPDAARVSGRSSGLTGMSERAALVGGRLTVESAPGQGTRLVATLPLGRGDRGGAGQKAGP